MGKTKNPDPLHGKTLEMVVTFLVNHYGFGKTIYEYAPSSSGAKDYQKTVQRILDNE